MSRQPQLPGPWWSDPGPVQCQFCLQAYRSECGYHCGDCDRPLCPVCVVTVRGRREVICPACRGQPEDM